MLPHLVIFIVIFDNGVIQSLEQKEFIKRMLDENEKQNKWSRVRYTSDFDELYDITCVAHVDLFLMWTESDYSSHSDRFHTRSPTTGHRKDILCT